MVHKLRAFPADAQRCGGRCRNGGSVPGHGQHRHGQRAAMRAKRLQAGGSCRRGPFPAPVVQHIFTGQQSHLACLAAVAKDVAQRVHQMFNGGRGPTQAGKVRHIDVRANFRQAAAVDQIAVEVVHKGEVAAPARANHGQARGHGFHVRPAPAFAPRREHKCIGGGVQTRQVGVQRLREDVHGREVCQAGAQLCCAKALNDGANVRRCGLRTRNLQDEVHALVAPEAACPGAQ